MTDHADTIRAAIENDYTTVGAKLGHDALDALLAERQQAQQERDQIARDYEWAWEQRRQAIDALREIARVRDDRADDPIYTRDVAADALVKLGETRC